MEQEIVARGFLWEGGKALIAKRSAREPLFPSHWELPGGKVEFGEEVHEALRRQLREGLGIEALVLGPFHCSSSSSDSGRRHTVEIGFACVREGDAPIRLGERHEECRWAAEGELEGFPMTPDEREMVRAGFRHVRMHGMQAPADATH